MIAIISSLIVIITVLISVMVGFAPNVRAVMQSDFMRSAINHIYMYGWEEAQLIRRAGGLTVASPTYDVAPDVVVGMKDGVNKEVFGVKTSLNLLGELQVDLTRK